MRERVMEPIQACKTEKDGKYDLTVEPSWSPTGQLSRTATQSIPELRR